MTLWLQVTTDQYELPLVVADSRQELARLCGVKPKTISEKISRRKEKCSYVKVEIEEVENEQ